MSTPMATQTTLTVNSPEVSEDEYDEVDAYFAQDLVRFFPYLAKHIASIALSWALLLIPIMLISTVNKIGFLDALIGKVPSGANPLPYDVMRVLEYLCLTILVVSIVSFTLGIFPRMILWAIGKVALGKKERFKHYLEVCCIQASPNVFSFIQHSQQR